MQSVTALPQAMSPSPFTTACAFAALQSLFRKQRGVNAAVHNPRAAGARHAAYLVATQRVAGVHADAHNVAGLNALRNNLLQRLIDQNGIAGNAWVWLRQAQTAIAA